MYACFNYFQKAFDSIWQVGLFYKMLESGKGGKTYDIIKSMYSGNMCSVKNGKMDEASVRAATSALHSSISI